MGSPTAVLLLALITVAAAQSCGQVFYNEQSAGQASAGAGNRTGVQTPGEALIGGSQARDGSWPWTVAICLKDWFGNCNYKATGAIISNKYVLTAYTGMDFNEKATSYYVRAGTINHKSGGQYVQVANRYVQPNTGDKDNIVVLELNTNVQFNEYVQPICLPNTDHDVETPLKTAWFTAWGHASNSVFAGVEQDLRQGLMPFIDDSVCENRYSGFNADTQLCAGGNGVTTCDFDMGGPLVQKHNGAWYLYGLSMTHDYAATGCQFETVFTRVHHFCGFIAEKSGVQCID